MREVNFSIPNVNKASVHITTTLYDRRALDCTSTLPLINSLNHLAYLTTSSARIRDILVVDGGVERLVSILKEGRTKDLKDMWKWNLAFQCVVNIGVRGSEHVRTRVVEADMVPVIATILDNYIRVTEEQRTNAESAHNRAARLRPGLRGGGNEQRPSTADSRHSRRQPPPPPLDIPQPFTQAQSNLDDMSADVDVNGPTVVTSPPERTTFSQQPRHQHHRSHDGRNRPLRNALQPLATAVPSMDAADGFAIRPVRDIDRLPSMLQPLPAGDLSQPESPTTPSAPPQHGLSTSATPRPRRPSLHQRRSTYGDSDDANDNESAASGDDTSNLLQDPPVVDVQAASLVEVEADEEMIDAEGAPITLTIPDASEAPDAETFNITHRSAVDGSILNTTPTPVQLTFSPVLPAPPANASPAITINGYSTFLRNTNSASAVHAMQPRDEDVLMSLQLLAYVSKYCNLRHFFQRTHLVPKLRLRLATDNPAEDAPMMDADNEDGSEIGDEDEEYLQSDDFNTFPLVEKFTVRHHSKDMQYWACVVMRNLCRKDESRGGIRQCAYYACGKWEEFTRQFAKCRRCRRTKYCSKDCQKNAWVLHRHWCHSPGS